ncbi:DUF6114 domain-containing protein [Streptomyces sirii]|uniref:DUF6114 domain-containing protein n=1 Tax=Streptomyces sirii TaxID=3127701 RepID=UPI003D35E87B
MLLNALSVTGPARRAKGWCRQRPAGSAALVCAAGAELMALPLLGAPAAMLQPGMAANAGFGVSLPLLLTGVVLLCFPQLHSLAGFAAVVLAVLALLTCNIGGLLLGTVLGIAGGCLAFSWVPPPRRVRPCPRASPHSLSVPAIGGIVASSVFAQARIRDPRLVRAYRACRRTVKADDATYYALTQLLPPAVRPAVWALCAGVRVTDDLVDTGPADPDERAARLVDWLAAFDDELRQGSSQDPVRHALIHTVQTWSLSSDDLRGAFSDLRQDPYRGAPETWLEWSAYCRRIITPTRARDC